MRYWPVKKFDDIIKKMYNIFTWKFDIVRTISIPIRMLSDFYYKKNRRDDATILTENRENHSSCHGSGICFNVFVFVCMIQRMLARRCCFKCFWRNSIDSEKNRILSGNSIIVIVVIIASNLRSPKPQQKEHLSGVEWRQQNQQTSNKYLLCNKIMIEQLLFQ